MAIKSSKLKWIEVRLGKDMNWWVEKTSDPIHWDTVDALSVLDPRQMAYMIDHADPLVQYGFHVGSLDNAFYRFAIEKDLGKGRYRLERVPDSIIDPAEPLFALPDVMDDEKGPYADLLHMLTRCRVKMLNDVIEFEEHLTIEEIEEELRDAHNEDYLEGRSTHIFDELMFIVDYVPAGYELDEDEESSGGDVEEAFPDLDVGEDDEKIEKDETMRWGDEEEEEADEQEFEEDRPPLADEVEGDEPAPKKKAKKATKKAPAKKAPAKKKAAKKAPAKKAVKKKAPAKKAVKKKAPAKKKAVKKKR